MNRVVQSSRTYGLLAASVERVNRWLAGSRTEEWIVDRWRRVRAGWRDSETESGVSVGTDMLRRSRSVGWFTRFGTRVQRVGTQSVSNARVGGLLSWIQVKIEQSLLYRWLTAEPEPEVIVIDLRDTYTAGPVIAGLDRAIAEILPGVQSATITQALAGLWRMVLDRPLRYVGVGVMGVTLVSLGLLATDGSVSTLVGGAHLLGVLVCALAIRSDRSWESLRSHPIMEWLAVAFEPPEPIERED